MSAQELIKSLLKKSVIVSDLKIIGTKECRCQDHGPRDCKECVGPDCI